MNLKLATLFIGFLLNISNCLAQNFEYVKTYGGTSFDGGNSVAVDSLGNVYTTGYFRDTVDFDPGPSTTNLISVVSDYDVFVLKSDSDGNLIWARQLGGTQKDYGTSIAIDDSGSVYTIGTFSGTMDFDPGIGVVNLTSGGTDIFVQKMDSLGNFLWAKSFEGGPTIDSGESITIDHLGNVYTTGFFSGTVDFDPGLGVTNLTSNGDRDVFVQKMNSAGDFLWAKSFGGTYYDVAYSIATDPLGSVYTTGFFLDVVDFDPGPGIVNLSSELVGPSSNATAFVHKMDAQGNLLWVKSFDGLMGGVGYGQSVLTDSLSNVYTSGIFYGTVDFDPGIGTSNHTSIGGMGTYIEKMNSSGNSVWIQSIAGSDSSEVLNFSIDLDKSGYLYSMGSFEGVVDFDPGNGIVNLTASIGDDTYVQKIDTSGNLSWVRSFGSYYPESMVVDEFENIYTTGRFSGTTDFDIDSATITNVTTNGFSDIFIHKINQCINTYGVDTIVTCDSYVWIDGNTYTASNNTASYILPNAIGCDSIITLNLTINSSSVIDIHTACDSFTWIDGNTYTSSNNNATFTLTNAAGCDSIITLDLTLYNSSVTIDTQVACDSFTWIDGNTYTSSNNTATFTLTDATGCDSIITLDLTLYNSSTATDTQVACDSFNWIDGNTYTSSNNTATFTLTNATGCDSIITLDLTLYNSSTATDTQVACDSFTWIDGNTYTSSNNTATFTLTNTVGCDSIVTLDLTLYNSATATDTQVACDSFTWIDGNTYTSSNNTATFTLTNTVGCDSIVTLDLTINTVSDISIYTNDLMISSNNNNASYQWLDCINNYAPIAGETNQVFTATINGNYAVELTESNCIDTSECMVINSVSVNELNDEDLILIYPNVTGKTVYITFEKKIDVFELELVDAHGKIAFKQQNFEPLSQQIDFDIVGDPGVYFLTIKTRKTKRTFKLIKI